MILSCFIFWGDVDCSCWFFVSIFLVNQGVYFWQIFWNWLRISLWFVDLCCFLFSKKKKQSGINVVWFFKDCLCLDPFFIGFIVFFIYFICVILINHFSINQKKGKLMGNHEGIGFSNGKSFAKGNFLSLSVGISYCRRMWWVLFRNKLYLLWGVERPWSLTIYRDFLSFFSHMISISSSFWFSFSFSYLCVSGTMVWTRGAHSKKTLASHSKIPFDIPDGTPLPSASTVPHYVCASSSSVGKMYKMKPPKQVALISVASPLIFPDIGAKVVEPEPPSKVVVPEKDSAIPSPKTLGICSVLLFSF